MLTFVLVQVDMDIKFVIFMIATYCGCWEILKVY